MNILFMSLDIFVPKCRVRTHFTLVFPHTTMHILNVCLQSLDKSSCIWTFFTLIWAMLLVHTILVIYQSCLSRTWIGALFTLEWPYVFMHWIHMLFNISFYMRFEGTLKTHSNFLLPPIFPLMFTLTVAGKGKGRKGKGKAWKKIVWNISIIDSAPAVSCGGNT